MTLSKMATDELPQEQAAKLLKGEIAYHFGYIAAKGGCLSSSSANQWIMITNQRVLFEAAVKEGEGLGAKFVHQSGSIPMAKVSFVGTSHLETKEGCSQKKTTTLKINSSGGEVVLAVPSQEEAGRIQGVIDEIISEK